MDGTPMWKDNPKILLLDDVQMNLEILAAIIESMGCKPYCALNVQEALEIMKDVKPQLILSDYAMPGMDGIEFCRLLKSKPQTRDIPFLIITAEDSDTNKTEAYEAGAVDFLPKPYDRIEVIMRVNNHLNTYRNKMELENYNRLMHKLAQEHQKEAEIEHGNLLLALCKIVERSEKGAAGHNERVGHNAHLLAQSMQLVPEYETLISDEFVQIIELAARLHDIGNIILPEAIRHQDEQTNEVALSVVKKHTEEGALILQEISDTTRPSKFLEMAIDIAKYHHAYWDGTGYPKGVKEKEIPLSARIVAVVNDFDILLTKKDGKEELSKEECYEILTKRSGTRYEPAIIDIFNKVCKRMVTDGEKG